LPFKEGSFSQHLEVPGVWLERGRLDACDARLMNGPLGLAGQRCMATLFFVAGRTLDRQRRETGLDVARQLIANHALSDTAGATCPNGQVMVVRALSPLVEPAMDLLRQVWVQWRAHFWQMSAVSPRIWST
jgi:urease accessory protein